MWELKIRHIGLWLHEYLPWMTTATMKAHFIKTGISGGKKATLLLCHIHRKMQVILTMKHFWSMAIEECPTVQWKLISPNILVDCVVRRRHQRQMTWNEAVAGDANTHVPTVFYRGFVVAAASKACVKKRDKKSLRGEKNGVCTWFWAFSACNAVGNVLKLKKSMDLGRIKLYSIHDKQ